MTASGGTGGTAVGARTGGALATVALVLGLALVAAPGARAAEVAVRGTGTFRPPAESTLAALPADSPVAAADLRAGTLSFEIVYDDAARDADPDPWIGDYPAAIRAFRVRIGASTVELPVAGATLRVSDGGQGVAYRESLTMQSTLRRGAHALTAGWVQLNERASTEDLRGAAGAIAGDAPPRAGLAARFPVSGDNDRAFVVRLDPAGGGRPVLYLNTSRVTVEAGPAVAR